MVEHMKPEVWHITWPDVHISGILLHLDLCPCGAHETGTLAIHCTTWLESANEEAAWKLAHMCILCLERTLGPAPLQSRHLITSSNGRALYWFPCLLKRPETHARIASLSLATQKAYTVPATIYRKWRHLRAHGHLTTHPFGYIMPVVCPLVSWSGHIAHYLLMRLAKYYFFLFFTDILTSLVVTYVFLDKTVP